MINNKIDFKRQQGANKKHLLQIQCKVDNDISLLSIFFVLMIFTIKIQTTVTSIAPAS